MLADKFSRMLAQHVSSEFAPSDNIFDFLDEHNLQTEEFCLVNISRK